ncbi:transcription factor GTE8-like [Primulina huaijiensis]|uniref:transcription factor GTE8-like n=1 Tax=Primulina huaijiensis TaxID=1492673 RepID=UPI003CC780EF
MAPTVPVDYTGLRESKKCPKNLSADMNGNRWKFSKGYSSRSVSDYRQAVEAMAESEGFGSSGQVAWEFTASEDSSTPKRKCIRLNVGTCDRFGLQMQVLSVSKMSSSERKDLQVKLRNDLKKVRMLQMKIDSYGIGAMVYEPKTDNYVYQRESVRTDVEGKKPFSMNEMVVPSGKRKAPSGKNGFPAKGGAVASGITKQGITQNTKCIMLMKQCETLLHSLMSQKHAWVFNEPVDVVKLNIPDYHSIIKHPMDLGTIKGKLRSNQYSSTMEFAADVRLTFKNALTYNSRGTEVHCMAEALSRFFEMRWKANEKKFPAAASESRASKSSVIIETHLPPSKKQKTTSLKNQVNQEIDRPLMSNLEKQKLGAELETLLAELPDNIIDFLKESTMNGNQVIEDEIEIDIDTLSDETLFMLRKLLDAYLLQKQKNQAKVEQCEIEMCNDSGFSDLSVQPCKDSGPPLSGSPAMGIDKDAARTDVSRYSNSRSSSSELGSASHDTDSESSAPGELHVAKEVVPSSTANENVDEKENSICFPNNGDFLDRQTEHNLLLRSPPSEPKCLQEGESAPPERQVSPDKLYRAAILRSRFADIIIKAQENSIDKGERPDPEKLKLEREELERRRREEKVRLQAEAKAVELARKKAEAEAAAEARKKIELEREAARQALQKMEQTVEINENCRFMEDLEMFRAAPDEHLQNLSEESPENSENCHGSFKFQASCNPLEQLGLYMKNDEEDEEVEPHSFADIPNDPEEGEID